MGLGAQAAAQRLRQRLALTLTLTLALALTLTLALALALTLTLTLTLTLALTRFEPGDIDAWAGQRGKVLLWMYVMVSNVLLVNLLIAMMGDTYARIKENADTEWKVRARVT